MGSGVPDGRQSSPAREAAHTKSGSPATHGPVLDDAIPTGPDTGQQSATEQYWEEGRDKEAIDTGREANEQAFNS
jgi:hypothetical protein